MTTQYGNVNDTSGYAQAFYNAYTKGYQLILQEMKDVYGGTVQQEPLEGEYKAYDFIGTVDLIEKATRFEDIPIDDMTHNRRWIYPRWFRRGIFWDPEDDIAIIADPTSPYIKSLSRGVVRLKNDVIYAALEGNVSGGKNPGDDTYAFNDSAFSSASEGGRTIPHDATNAFAAGGTSAGLTIEKLILAREALVSLKNDPNQMFHIVCNQRQISDLLREAEVQSIDTNIVRALHAGTISEYHGFTFHVDYNITLGTSNDIDADTNIYPCYAYTNDALLYAQHEAPIFNMDWIPRKQIYQIAAKVGMNSVRMDEDKVIKIECAAV